MGSSCSTVRSKRSPSSTQRRLGGLQRLGERGRGDVAEVLDVQALAARQVEEPLAQLGRAGAGVGAAQVDVALLHRPQRRPALGALGRHHELPLAAVPQVDDRAEDLRDDVAGLAQHDRVADEDALGLDDVLVVQGGELDLGAGHRDRLDLRVRRDPAGAADADPDVDQLGVDLLRRVLPGDGPARRARGGAEAALERDLVELDDHAVDLVLHGVPVLAVVRDELPYAVERRRPPWCARRWAGPSSCSRSYACGEAGRCRRSPRRAPMPCTTMCSGRRRGDPRVLLAQRTRPPRCAGWRRACRRPPPGGR